MENRELSILTIIKHLPSGVLIQINEKQLIAQIEGSVDIIVGVPVLCVITYNPTYISIKKFNDDDINNSSINIVT